MTRQTSGGIGGFPDPVLVDYVLGFADGRRVLVDGTASPDYGCRRARNSAAQASVRSPIQTGVSTT
jgi:hypothetical protein